jgi:hypothetical protein
MKRYNGYYTEDEEDGSIEVVPSRKDVTLKYKNKIVEAAAQLVEKQEKEKLKKKKR